jgi:cytoskeleton protein RodZ
VAKLAPTQVEQLQNIGAYLRQVRQQQGLSLDLLANQIFIRPALLQALETGQGAALPEPIFIQGFIRRYAEALGLDGVTISHEFQVTPAEVLPTPDLVAPAADNGAIEQEMRHPEQQYSERHHNGQVLEKAPPAPTVRSRAKRGRSPLPLLLGLAAVAAILGLGAWGLLGRSGDLLRADRNSPTAEPPPADINAGTQPAETEATAPENAAEPAAAAPLEAPVVVSANLRDRAWLSVVADGRNVYEGIAERGFEETWTAQSSLVFRTGNAGGVELSVNGDRPVVMGNSGMVRTLTLTPDSGVDSVQSP